MVGIWWLCSLLKAHLCIHTADIDEYKNSEIKNLEKMFLEMGNLDPQRNELASTRC